MAFADQIFWVYPFLHEKGLQAVQLYHYGLAPLHLLKAAAHTLEKFKGVSRD